MIRDDKVEEYPEQKILQDIYEWMDKPKKIVRNGIGIHAFIIPMWEFNNIQHNIKYLIETRKEKENE